MKNEFSLLNETTNGYHATRKRCLSIVALFFSCLGGSVVIGDEPAANVDDLLSSDMTKATIQNKDITESSGLAMSWRDPTVLWTHNDSGDSARLFALGRNGQHLQEVLLTDAQHVDWEDMASYVREGKPQLMIGDVGDNALRREHVVCYRVNEPKLGNKKTEVHGQAGSLSYGRGEPKLGIKKIKVDQVWKIRYPDGPRDCEAIAVDVHESLILLCSKAKGFVAEIYAVPLETGKDEASVTATLLGTIAVPMITGMDVHAIDRRILIATYADTWIFHRIFIDGTKRTDWQATLQQTPTLIRTPWRRQGEAACFDVRDNAIWLTSEKKPTPLFRVSIAP